VSAKCIFLAIVVFATATWVAFLIWVLIKMIS
jgi:hypothetical protein